MKKNGYKWKNEKKEVKSVSKSDSKENITATLEGNMVVSISSKSCICVASEDMD